MPMTNISDNDDSHAEDTSSEGDDTSRESDDTENNPDDDVSTYKKDNFHDNFIHSTSFP